MCKQVLLAAALFVTAMASSAADKKIIFIAGNPSHGPGEHEHRAGCLLLQQSLSNTPGIVSEVHSNGWPRDEKVLESADAIIMYSDGGGGHPAIKPERLKVLKSLLDKGVGFGTIHYACEVPKDKGGPEFLDWIGGYFETFWSVNPHWTADFTKLPAHPISQGVKPFAIRDEWYYHMRFRDGMQGVTPILSAVPPDATRGKPGANSSHGGNPEVQKHMGEPEHVMWAATRGNNGRGFGFTGGHFHKNWGDDNFRKVVLNAILWVARADVPDAGVDSKITAEDLARNLDQKGQARPRAAAAPAPSARPEPFISPTLPAK